MMKGTVVTPIAALQQQLEAAAFKDGELQVLPASFYNEFPQEQISYFCALRAIYCLPTTELVEFLKQRIAGRSAIEIGSGSGVLGKALGIPCTDSYLQENPEIAAHYRAMRQPTIAYGKHVERIDALDAVKKYEPQVVVGAWVTEYCSPLEEPGPLGGCMFGVKETDILRAVEEYIVVGHEGTHSHKKISRTGEETLYRDWIKSRSMMPGNVIYIWKGQKHVGLR